MSQLDLFGAPLENPLPPGLRYDTNVVPRQVQDMLLGEMASLAFEPFDFHGFLGKRRVVSFGWKYDFDRERLREGEPMPGFLLPVRELAAAFAGLPPDDLKQVLVTEYGPGAAIGWHKDKGVFGEVVGISLLSRCTFRLRRRAGDGWDRLSFTAEPGSAYLLSGEARTDWEHSIPPVDTLRYSLTFRSLRARE